MKKIKTAFKKYIGELLLTIGSFATAYSVFNFRSIQSGSARIVRPGHIVYHHYYSDITLYCIAFGVSLIVIGILIIRNKARK